MALEEFDIEFDAGASYRMCFEPALEDLTTGDEEPYDLDAGVFKLYLTDSKRVWRADYLLTVEHEPALGKKVVRVIFSAEQTKKYRPHKRYYYTIFLHHPSGDAEKILQGLVRVYPSTTLGGNHG